MSMLDREWERQMEQLYVDKKELLESVRKEIAESLQEPPKVQVPVLWKAKADLKEFLAGVPLAKTLLLMLLSANLVAVVLLIVFLVMILVKM